MSPLAVMLTARGPEIPARVELAIKKPPPKQGLWMVLLGDDPLNPATHVLVTTNQIAKRA